MVEVFAGIGGVLQGFERTERFRALLLTDCDRLARDTYLENFPQRNYLLRKVEDLTPRVVLNAAAGGAITGLLGCPPCQGFSAAGLRDTRDPRNGLLAHYFRLLRALLPPFFVMENVPRVLESQMLQRALKKAQREYLTWHGTVNSALYGVPQTRQRAIVIGFRRDLGIMPCPPPITHFGSRPVFDYRTGRMRRPTIHSADALLGTSPDVIESVPSNCATGSLGAHLENLVVLEEAIGDLPAAGDDDSPLSYESRPSEYARLLRSASVTNHQRWQHTKHLLNRVAHIPEGGGLLDHYGRSRSRPYFSQAYSRLHRRGLARTLTTNFHNSGSGRFLHYADLRTLTVREAARIQGFPDTFLFLGSRTDQERLIGNAFPIELASKLAARIVEQLDQAGLTPGA